MMVIKVMVVTMMVVVVLPSWARSPSRGRTRTPV
jgi:hypothetical protein